MWTVTGNIYKKVGIRVWKYVLLLTSSPKFQSVSIYAEPLSNIVAIFDFDVD